jgi:hypothetical protein
MNQLSVSIVVKKQHKNQQTLNQLFTIVMIVALN